jgi:hypothetical protein
MFPKEIQYEVLDWIDGGLIVCMLQQTFKLYSDLHCYEFEMRVKVVKL